MDRAGVFALVLLGGGTTALLLSVLRRVVRRAFELKRFEGRGGDASLFEITRLTGRIFRESPAPLLTQGRLFVTTEELHRLQEIGSGDPQATMRYVALREAWIAMTTLVCLYSLCVHSAVFAALFTCAAIVLAVWVPRGLLDLEWEARRRALRLEIPLVFGLLASAFRATSEVVRVFEDCADILYGKHNGSTLAHALTRAKWRSRVMGSWHHGLNSTVESLSGTLVDEAVRKLSRVVQPEEEDIDGGFQTLTIEALERLQHALAEHYRLVAIKVVVITSAGAVGGVLLSGLPLWGSWGG
jgi:hypothetical protein